MTAALLPPTSFHHNRIPLLIFIAGTRCIGKSTLATLLAERLNLGSVLQTNIIYELMCSMSVDSFDPQPLWDKHFDSDNELLIQYRKECKIIQKGVPCARIVSPKLRNLTYDFDPQG